MTQHYIGACAFSKAEVPHMEACHSLGVFALGWGRTRSIENVSPRLLSKLVWDTYPNYKREPREAAEMLELIQTMKAGDKICFRHRHKSVGSVIVAIGEVTSGYFWDESRVDDLFEGHDCAHRVGVKWDWFDPDCQPAFPEVVWERVFGRIKQGRSLVRATPADWEELQTSVEGVERLTELDFGEDE